MIVESFNTLFYGAVFLCIFILDYSIGNGFVDMLQKIICKVSCFVKKSFRADAGQNSITGNEHSLSLPTLITEIIVLSLTMAFLNKFKQYRAKDRIDELLQESKDALRETNEFLEKWRLRRVPTEYSYLDEEPQEIKPLNLEVPILHMAIIDTLGTTRSQPERGDAGDTINITDSTLLSVTSLLDEDLESIPPDATSEDKMADEAKTMEFRNRYLWDVMEEDVNSSDD